MYASAAPVVRLLQLLKFQAGATGCGTGRIGQYGPAGPSPCGRLGRQNAGVLLEEVQEACQSPGQIRG